MIIKPHQQYEPEDIGYIIAAIEPSDTAELIRAVMVLCDVVKRQGWRIAELEDAVEKHQAAAEFYRPT